MTSDRPYLTIGVWATELRDRELGLFFDCSLTVYHTKDRFSLSDSIWRDAIFEGLNTWWEVDSVDYSAHSQYTANTWHNRQDTGWRMYSIQLYNHQSNKTSTGCLHKTKLFNRSHPSRKKSNCGLQRSEHSRNCWQVLWPSLALHGLGLTYIRWLNPYTCRVSQSILLADNKIHHMTAPSLTQHQPPKNCKHTASSEVLPLVYIHTVYTLGNKVLQWLLVTGSPQHKYIQYIRWTVTLNC